jgi:hypothetical protein
MLIRFDYRGRTVLEIERFASGTYLRLGAWERWFERRS